MKQCGAVPDGPIWVKCSRCGCHWEHTVEEVTRCYQPRGWLRGRHRREEFVRVTMSKR